MSVLGDVKAAITAAEGRIKTAVAGAKAEAAAAKTKASNAYSAARDAKIAAGRAEAEAVALRAEYEERIQAAVMGLMAYTTVAETPAPSQASTPAMKGIIVKAIVYALGHGDPLTAQETLLLTGLLRMEVHD